MTPAYERYAQKLLIRLPKPKPFGRFDGVNFEVGTKPAPHTPSPYVAHILENEKAMTTPEKDLRDEIIGQLTVALEQEKNRVYELLTQLETVRKKLEEAAASTKHKGYWI